MLKRGRSLGALLFGRKPKVVREGSMGIGEASVHHALVVIFLEYFAWGLLTVPVINVSLFFEHFNLLNSQGPRKIKRGIRGG